MSWVLVTGGCGFIGTNIAEHYAARGHDVAVVDNMYRHGSQQNRDWLAKQFKDRIAFHHVDIAATPLLFDVFQKYGAAITSVFHFAGQVAATTSIEDPIRDFQVNALGTFNVCEAARRFAPEALLVFASTNKVYGDLAQFDIEELPTRYVCRQYPRGFPETVPLDFHSPYGCSKGCGDQYTRDYHRVFGLSSVVLRLSTVFGTRQFTTFDQGWVGWFAQQFLQNVPFTISGTGKQVRDILFVEDLLALLDGLVANKRTVAGQIFNVGGGIDNSLSLLELFELLTAEVKTSPRFERLAKRQGDQDFYVSDTSALEVALGWKPKVDKLAGVRRIIEWKRTLA